MKKKGHRKLDWSIFYVAHHFYLALSNPLFIALCLLLLTSKGYAQVTGILIDSETRTPIPFATLQLGNTLSGTISAIDGTFIISTPSTEDSLTINCLGYRSKKVAIRSLIDQPLVKLTQETITLEQIDVFPGVNPALVLMENVVRAIPDNNPEETTDYTCIVYHKMVFRLDTDHPIAEGSDSLHQKMIESSNLRDLMLIESVSEKRHMAPDKNYERMISGRVSGFKQPELSILPSQLQPFSFYAEKITLLDETYLNPVSEKGLEKYLFLLEDTIIEQADTLYHVTFAPRIGSNINGLSGFLHIDAPSLAIKDISAETTSLDAPVEVRIHQNYTQLEGKQWFPSQLESTLLFKSSGTNSFFRYPLIATAKGMVSAVNLNPELSPKDFSEITFEETFEEGSEGLNQFRYQPLTSKDSATYYFTDSLGQKFRLDKLVDLQKSLVKGFVPVGPLLIELKHLIGYNNFEGLKLGMGLYTNENLLKPISLGGFYNRSLKQSYNNYGGGIKWTLNEGQEMRFSLDFRKSLSTTGKFSFLKGPQQNISNLFRSLSASTMDRTEIIEATIHTRFLKYFRALVFYNTTQLTPVVSYPFYKLDREIDSPYSINQAGVKLRWNHNEKLKKTSFGWMTEDSRYPTVWFNVMVGRHDHPSGNSQFQKYEGQIEQSIHLTRFSKTTLRILAGNISSPVPNDQLFSDFGTFRPFSLEIPFMFSTMAPNEFAADQFSLAFLRHQIPLRENKTGRFKPNLILTTNAGWGRLSDASKTQSIKSFDKGYYESGLYFSNLFSQLFIKYGLAVHYRYGPYQKDKTIDNFSFRIGLEFSL